MSKFWTNSTVATLTTEGEFIWRSKTFQYPHATNFPYCRADMKGSGSITVKAVAVNTNDIAIGSSEATISVTGEMVELNQSLRSNAWYFEITGGNSIEVFSVEFLENKVLDTKGSTIVVTPRDIDTWRAFTLRYPSLSRPCFIYAVNGKTKAQTGTPVNSLKISGNNTTVTNANPGTMGWIVPRSLPRTLYQDVEVAGHGHTDLAIESLTAYMRTVRKVNNHLHIAHDNTIPPWLIEGYEFPDKSPIASIVVMATGTVNMRMFTKDSSEPFITVTIGSANAVAIPLSHKHQYIEFDFNGFDYLVQSVHIFKMEAIPVKGPVRIHNPENVTNLLFRFDDNNAFAAESLTVLDSGGFPSTTHGYLAEHDDPGVREQLYTVSGQPTPSDVKSLILWPFENVPVNEVIRETAQAGEMPPWVYRKYIFDKPRIITSIALESENGSENISIALDGGAMIVRSIPGDGIETAIPNMAACTMLQFRAGSLDRNIRSVRIYTREVIQVDERGFSKTGGDHWVNVALAFETPNRFVCARVLGKPGSTLTLTPSAGVGATIDTDGVQMLPRTLGKSVEWTMSADGIHPDQVTLLPRTVKTIKNTARIINDGFIPEWLHSTYELEGKDRLTSVFVSATSAVTMNIYLDGAVTASYSLDVTTTKEYSLMLFNLSCSAFEIDFGGDDADVQEVIVWADPTRIIGEDIMIEGEDHWMGRRFKFPDRGEWACVSVGSDSYPVELTLTGRPGVGNTHSVSLPNGYMVSLDRNKEASEWWLDLEAHNQGSIYNLWAKARTRVPVEDTMVRIAGQDTAIHPWWWQRWEIPNKRYLTGIKVDADSYPISCTLYATGAVSKSTTITIPNSKEVDVSSFGSLVGAIDIDFGDDAHSVNEAWLIFQPEHLVGADGLILAGSPSYRNIRYAFQELNRFAVAAIKATNYNGLRLSVDGETYTVSDGKPIILKNNTSNVNQGSVDVWYTGTSDGHIESVTLIPYRVQAVDGDQYVVTQLGAIPEFLYTRYELPKKQRIMSVYIGTDVSANQSLQISVTPYPSGVKQAYNVTPYREARIDVPRCGAFTFHVDYNPSGTRILAPIDDLILHMEKHIQIENRHTIMREINPTMGLRCNVLRFNDTGSFAAIRVVAEEHDENDPIVVTPYVDGVLQPYVNVNSNELHDLNPDMPNGREWFFDINSPSIVRELHLITKEPMLFNGKNWVVTRDSLPWSWRHHRLLAPVPVMFTCARVVSDVYPVNLIVFRPDDGVEYNYQVSNERPFRLLREQKARQWRIDVTGAPDSKVFQVALGTSMESLRYGQASQTD